MHFELGQGFQLYAGRDRVSLLNPIKFFRRHTWRLTDDDGELLLRAGTRYGLRCASWIICVDVQREMR
jgi:hypothetical protein